ncbi:MAG: transcriptional regulator NrdR [Persephonella sp.]|nr:MAG: transcriptional regulator NrdR [Persephonella sp.]RUM61101.1 MAG: transcriptional regulator NrdR [Persephonella sp.]
MKCPNCGSFKDRVLDTRQSKDGTVIRRRRECLECGFRFTTYERFQEEKVLVKKKKGDIEPFNKEKIERGIKLASKNRPVSEEQIKAIANFVEKYLLEEGKLLVESMEIGKLVQEKLKEIDKIAYIRFKSVCNDVSDIKEFENILNELKEN